MTETRILKPPAKMNLIYQIADRVYHASHAELAGYTLVFSAIIGMGAIAIYGMACRDSLRKTQGICAWCNPGPDARGICPHHKRYMVEQARECAARNGGVL